METSELLQQLGREIHERQLTRDQLLAQVLAIGEDLRELSSQERLVRQLVERIDQEDLQSQHLVEEPDVSDQLDIDGQKALTVSWPIGPHYQKKVKAKK